MATEGAPEWKKKFHELKRLGVLLLSDLRFPSVTTLVAGKPIRGSWWGHPKGRDIFRVAGWIADHPDVAVTKLISGKVTFVHRKLWPALLAIATAREPWQTNGLSRKARNLLQIVDQKGEVRTDRLPVARQSIRSPWSEATRELEERLLIYGEEFHSETGAHVKRLESWKHWADLKGFKLKSMKAEQAKKHFAEILHAVNEEFRTKAWLPWSDNQGIP
jgi:hypothetical protein